MTTRARALFAGLLLSCGCGRSAELTACNIADASCQRDVYYAVVRLRGDGFDPFAGLPPIHTVSLAAYRAELLRQDAAQQKASQQTPKQQAVDPWNAALQLLGLVTPSVSATQASVANNVENVAAFFSSATGEVTVIDRGGARDDASDTELLAHELVHAFQARERAGEAVSHSTDGYFASQALIEGEATLYEHLARAEIDQIKPQSVLWDRYYGNWAASLRQNLGQEQSHFYAVSWFVYPLGGDYLTRAWLVGGNAAVRRLGTDFPTSELALMTSFDHGRSPALAARDCQSAAPNDSYALAGHDRFGSMQLYGFLAGPNMDDAEAWATSLLWRNDEVWVYFDAGSMQASVSWRVHMADAASADRVVTAALANPDAPLHARREGNDALIYAADDAGLIPDWLKPSECK
ncbi:MAG: hypothetical protein ACHQ53_14650 [Polyangiales bacterium]